MSGQGFDFLPGTLKAIAATAKTGSTCTAEIGGIITSIEVARDLTVSAGDALLVTRSGATWYAICRTGVSAPVPPPEPPPAPPRPTPPQTGRLVVSPVETRSYRPGGWRTDTDDVYQGQYGGNGNHRGCAFYGAKVRSLAGATCTRITVRIRRRDIGGTNAAQDSTLWLTSERFRPSGAPSFITDNDGPNLRRGQTVDAYVLPNAWGQAMIDGTAGGICTYEADGSPYAIFAGRGSWSPAWTLSVSWVK